MKEQTKERMKTIIAFAIILVLSLGVTGKIALDQTEQYLMRSVWNHAYDNEEKNRTFNCVDMSIVIGTTLASYNVSFAYVWGRAPDNRSGHVWIYLDGHHVDSTTLCRSDDLPDRYPINLRYLWGNATYPSPFYTFLFSETFK